MVPVLGLAPNNFLEPVTVLISAPVPVLVARSASSFAVGFISNSAASFVCEAQIAMEFESGAPSPVHHREKKGTKCLNSCYFNAQHALRFIKLRRWPRKSALRALRITSPERKAFKF